MGIFSGSLDCDCCEEEEPPPPPNATAIGAFKTWWYMNDAFAVFQQGKPGIDHRQFTLQVPLKNGDFQSKLFPPDGAGRINSPSFGYLNPDTSYFTPNRDLNWMQKPCMELCGAQTCSLPQQPPYNSVNCGGGVGGYRILKSSTTNLVEAQFTYVDPGFSWSYNATGPGPVGGPGSMSNTGSVIFVQDRFGNQALTGGAAPVNQSPLNSENNRAGWRYGFEWDKNPQPSKTLWDIMAPTGKVRCKLKTKVWYWFGIAVASPNAYKLYADDFGGARNGVTMDFQVGFAGVVGDTDLDIARKLHKPTGGTILWNYQRSLTLPGNAACVGYLDIGNQKKIDYGPGQVSEINATTGLDLDVDITALLKGTNISHQVLGFYFIIAPMFTDATTTWGFLRTDIWGQSQITPSNPNGVGRSFGYSSAVSVYTDNNWQLVFE